jgi:hypothetical protein
MPLGPYAALQAALTLEVSARLAVALQAAVDTSPIRGTGLHMLGLATCYVVAGLTWRVAPNTSFELGLGENVLSFQRGADFTIVLGVRTGAGARARPGAWSL